MAKPYKKMKREELVLLRAQLEKEYREIQARGMHLDMSRGKPSKEQINLSMRMMEALPEDPERCINEEGIDCRNYGCLSGIIEAKRLLGQMIECPVENIVIYGNSSLEVMYSTLSRAMQHGIMGYTPWVKQGQIKFLCPVPGYDRHFAMTEYFGIEMINIPMLTDGPDMDLVEKYVENDPLVKGIWCVPKYANPTGISYSKEVVERFAALEPAAPDFRIFWDNAYSIHHLYPEKERQDYVPEILNECKKAGHADMVFKFCSTSKVTFPGSGLAAIATSVANVEDILQQLQVQTIGFDKLNQLRHVHFFTDLTSIKEHMIKHADIIRPKFEIVWRTLEEEIGDLGIAHWTYPKGGYFISLDTMGGCAKMVVQKCKEAGVILTDAGATYPYGKDPHDCNIRIAPTYPTEEELKQACEVLVLCIKIASVEKLLSR